MFNKRLRSTLLVWKPTPCLPGNSSSPGSLFFSPQSPEALSGQRTAPSRDLLHPPAAVKTPPPAPFCIEKGSEETKPGKAGAPLSYPPPAPIVTRLLTLSYQDQAPEPTPGRPLTCLRPRDGSQQTSPASGAPELGPKAAVPRPPPPDFQTDSNTPDVRPPPRPLRLRTQVPPSLHGSQLRPKLLLEPTQADQPPPLAAVPRSRGC